MKTLIQDIKINSVEKAEEILKAAGTEDLFEKARTDGEMHPNGRWVWHSSANNGKGDWRVANPKKGQGSTSKVTKKEHGEKTLQPLKSGSLLHYEDGEVWQVTKENKMKPYNELAKKNNISLSIEISKEGLTKVTN